MIAKLLRLCGLYLGEEGDLLPAVPYNTDGLWENRKFVELNEEILNALGCGWDHPPPLPPSWNDERLAPLRGKASALLHDFQDHDPWGWKDPRNCLTLSLWLSLLPEAKVVIPCRNPLEVALSLRRRGYPSATKALELWQAYNQFVIDCTSPETRIVTHYSSYFPDPQKELVRVLTFLNLRVPQAVVDQACSSALADLRHGSFSASQLRKVGVSPDVMATYMSMCLETAWSDGVASLPQGKEASERAAGAGTRSRYSYDVPTEKLHQDESLPLPPLSSSPEADLLERELVLEKIQPQLTARDRTIRDLRAQLQGFDQLRCKVEEQGAQLRCMMEEQGAQLRAMREQLDLLNRCASWAIDRWAPDLGKTLAYVKQILRTQQVVRATLPAGATVLVVSKGDEELLKLDGRTAWHFPQTLDGVYAGTHPANSIAAIAQLEALRVRGADYLLFPSTALWWLEHYTAFRDHLRRRYQEVVRQDDACVVYDLCEPRASQMPTGPTSLENVVAQCRKYLDCEPAILDWDTGLHLATLFPHLTVFSPPALEEKLPYLDGSIDIVAVPPDPASIAEARRVARVAILTAAAPRNGERGIAVLKVEWLREWAKAPTPVVSIILWASPELDQMRRQLDVLRCSLPSDFRGEVVLLTDGLAASPIEERVRRLGVTAFPLKVLEVDGSDGYAASCNKAATEASGDVLIFLGDVVIPLDDWLVPLLNVFDNRPRVGAVGGKVIAADGSLDQAGGVIFSDASATGFGGGDYQLDDPLYEYVRTVDYSSEHLLVTTRLLFQELGGFDPSYHNPTYAHADYCFRVRGRGYGVYYQPQSVSVSLPYKYSHIVTLGRFARNGESDQTLFSDRWKKILEHQPSPRYWRDRDVWHALAVCGASGAEVSR
jgi:hypothetical protein